MKIGIIGCGHLGTELVRRFLEAGISTPGELVLLERSAEKAEGLQREFECRVLTRAAAEIAHPEVIVLAVRPQDFESAGNQIAEYIGSNQVILSVMTGITFETMRSILPSAKHLVRCMPNLPVRIGRGLIPYCLDVGWREDTRKKVLHLFSTLGTPLKLERESEFARMTGLSGSGPGYVFFLLESLLSAADALGFSKDQAHLILRETILGTVEYWTKSGKDAGELREAMRLKGGTTEAAYGVLDGRKVKDAIRDAVLAAAKRAEELSSKD